MFESEKGIKELANVFGNEKTQEIMHDKEVRSLFSS
jgi:hypothetical protein